MMRPWCFLNLVCLLGFFFSKGVRALVLARERGVKVVVDVDPLKVVWVDGWSGNKGAKMESNQCNVGFECVIANCARKLSREEARDIEDPRVFRKFAEFCFCLGLSIVSFEKDNVKLMKRMKEKKDC